MGSKTTVASLAVEITGDVSGLNRALGTAERSVERTGSRISRGLDSIGTGWKLLGTTMFGFGAAGVMVAADFEASMREISARTGLVGEDLDSIREFALKMGADTSFSAQQASDAFLQLLTSGSSVEESISTLPHVMALAASSGLELGYTADVLTDIMAQFGLEVESAGGVTDALAKAAGASSAEVGDLAQGFANVGPNAHMFGLTVEETAAALATLAENGIKGAEGGTALKSLLLNLVRPTDKVTGALDELGVSLYDVDGNFRNIDDVIDDLDYALDGLPMNEQIRLSTLLAGSYGITAFNALRASGGIDAMLDSMDEAAGASEVAEARLGGFHGAIERLKGSLETLAIKTLTPLMESVITPAINVVVDTIDTWTNDIPEQSRILGDNIGRWIVEGAKANDPFRSWLADTILSITKALDGSVEVDVPIEPIPLIPTEAGDRMVAQTRAEIDALLERGLPVSHAVSMLMDVQQGFRVLPVPEIDPNWDTPETAAELAGMMSLSSPVALATDVSLTPHDRTPGGAFNLHIGAYMNEIVNGQVFALNTDVAATPELVNPPEYVTSVANQLQALQYLAEIEAGMHVIPTVDNGAVVAADVARFLEAQGYSASVIASVHVQPAVTVGSTGIAWVDAALAAAGQVGATVTGNVGLPPTAAADGTHRAGLDYVPYDNYLAVLHRGERVLTAAENRGGGGVTINVTGGVFANGPQEFAEYVKRLLSESGH